MTTGRILISYYAGRKNARDAISRRIARAKTDAACILLCRLLADIGDE